jgi:hypothetical protein
LVGVLPHKRFVVFVEWKKRVRDNSEKIIKNTICSNGRCYLHDTLSHKVTASKWHFRLSVY